MLPSPTSAVDPTLPPSSAVVDPSVRCDTFEVASATEEPREEQLDALIRIGGAAEEAAEAAAEAAAHAVEAVKAAEEAKEARVAKAAQTLKAAKASKKAKSSAASKAARKARKSKIVDEATAPSAPLSKRSTKARRKPGHVLELRLNDAENEQIEKLAAEKGISADALARFLLVESLGRSGED